MKRSVIFLIAAFLFGTVLCVADVHIFKVDIPFSFMAAGKTYPAGNYEFLESSSADAVIIRSVKPGVSGIVQILTRLSGRPASESGAVFDVVGNDHFLSEIYGANMDGFLIKGATTKHTHVSLKAKAQ